MSRWLRIYLDPGEDAGLKQEKLFSQEAGGSVGDRMVRVVPQLLRADMKWAMAGWGGNGPSIKFVGLTPRCL